MLNINTGVHLFITIISLAIMVGCTNQPSKEHQFQIDRSAYFPLAVYTTNSTPKLESKAYTDDVRGGGTVKCLVGAFAFTFGLLAPLCAPLAVADGMAVAEIEARQQDFVSMTETLIPRVEKLSDEAIFRTHIMDYLLENNVEAKEIVDKSILSDSAEISEKLHQHGYPAALEISLLLVQFYEAKDKFCLKMQVNGRTIRTKDNQQIALREGVIGKCMVLSEWMTESTLENEASKLYATASKHLADELIFIYEDAMDSVVGLKILSPIPKPVVGSREYKERKEFEEKCDWVNHDCSDAMKSTEKPESYAELQPFYTNIIYDYGIMFTDVGLSPSFVWSELNLPDATDISYEIRIYEGRNQVGSRSNRFTGTYALNHRIIPTKVFYERDNLSAASHQLEVTLEPCHWYFWTVRAKFIHNGNYRVTDWSSIDDQFGKHYYPLRTSASEHAISCWKKSVYWGPCNREKLSSAGICVK